MIACKICISVVLIIQAKNFIEGIIDLTLKHIDSSHHRNTALAVRTGVGGGCEKN